MLEGSVRLENFLLGVEGRGLGTELSPEWGPGQSPSRGQGDGCPSQLRFRCIIK